jgi:hypothetical protein
MYDKMGGTLSMPGLRRRIGRDGENDDWVALPALVARLGKKLQYMFFSFQF